MPAARTTPSENSVTARRLLLAGLAQDAALPDLLGDLAPLHPRNNTFPGEVVLRLAADALAWAGVGPAEPLSLEEMRQRLLPEYSGRGRDRREFQFAALAAAALHGGVEPDLLEEVARWQGDDFWQYALLAAVAYVRAAARAAVPVHEACTELADRPGRQPG